MCSNALRLLAFTRLIYNMKKLLFLLPLIWIAATVQAQTYTVIRNLGVLSSSTGSQPQGKLVQGPDGALYGAAYSGGGNASLHGTIFKIQPDGSGFAVLKYFTNVLDGINPQGGFAISGNTLYGTTVYGGSTNANGTSNPGFGTVFKINTDGSGFTVLMSFSGTNGDNPNEGLLLNGNTLYGTCFDGVVFKINTDGMGFSVIQVVLEDGINSAELNGDLVLQGNTLFGTTGGPDDYDGSIFRVNTDGTGFDDTRFYDYTATGIFEPRAGFVLSGNVLYGTTYLDNDQGGLSSGSGNGSVFAITTDYSLFPLSLTNGGYLEVLHFFDDQPYYATSQDVKPANPLVFNNGVLYGTTQGTVFSVNANYTGFLDNGSGYKVLKTFGFGEGLPNGGLLLIGSTLYGATGSGGSGAGGTIFKINTDGNGYAVLKTFDGVVDSRRPSADLLVNGNTLYGTSQNGGSVNCGTVFRVNTDGSGSALLESFDNQPGDAYTPIGGLVSDGTAFYGTASTGGADGYGAIFKINPDGTGFNILQPFLYTNGKTPTGDLLLNGNTLYGTTEYGGSTGFGTVFKINTDGSPIAVIKSFAAASLNASGYYTNNDGAFPYYAGLVLSGNTLYGTTINGGTNGFGTVFKVNTDGNSFQVIHTFDITGGAYPEAGLVLKGSTLYGTAYTGGSTGDGTIFKVNTDGTGFTRLRTFTGSPGDGEYPEAGLALKGNTLYGTTYQGGTNNDGTAFQIQTDGSGYSVIKSFAGSDGYEPQASLVVNGNTLYGTTFGGGAMAVGVVFKIDLTPVMQPPVFAGGQSSMTWGSISNVVYQLQYSTNLNQSGWVNIGNPITATNTTTSVKYPLTSDLQRFYRVVYQP
jgi:uncharacterized repeat protein (TIGR03803 family)